MVVLAIAMGCEKDPPVEDTPDPVTPVERQDTFLISAEIEGRYGIYLYEGPTRSEIIAGDLHRQAWWPRLSPDRSKMLYYITSSDSNLQSFESAELWIYEFATQRNEKILDHDNHGWMFHGMATWSPDGDRIAFSASDSIETNWQLYTCSPAGDDIVKITDQSDQSYLDPLYTKDGLSIICAVAPPPSAPNSDNLELYEIDLASLEEQRLTSNDTRDQHPSLSPSGIHLVFESLVDPTYLGVGKWSLKQLNLVTGEESILYDDHNLNLHPSFGSQGQHLFFVQVGISSLSASARKLDWDTKQVSSLDLDLGNVINIQPF